MMRLPHAESAALDLRKLKESCLNASHPRGRHKARVFLTALGIGQGDATWLRHAILDGLRSAEATAVGKDAYGTMWQADVTPTRQNRRCVVRTIWIVRAGEEIPRFVTCWVR